MGCNDIDKLKALCIDMMKNHARTEVVLSNAMMRMLELEAKLAVLQTPPIKNRLLYRFRLFIEKAKLIRQIRQPKESLATSISCLLFGNYNFRILYRFPSMSTFVTLSSTNDYEF